MILAINLLILVWLLKIMLIDEVSDSIGAVVILVVVFLLFFNLYSLVLYNLFRKYNRNTIFHNIMFLILLILPIMAIWYYTS